MFTIDPVPLTDSCKGFLVGRIRVEPQDWPIEFHLKALRGLSMDGPRLRDEARTASHSRAAVEARCRSRGRGSDVGRVAVAPIAASDLSRVGTFLNKNLNKRVSGSDWARAARVPWSVDSPNHGFMLRDENDIVGVYLAFYSSRTDERPAGAIL